MLSAVTLQHPPNKDLGNLKRRKITFAGIVHVSLVKKTRISEVLYPFKFNKMA